MDKQKSELEQKQQRLKELIKSRSQANCSAKYSKAADVKREMEIEELEQEIEAIKAKM